MSTRELADKTAEEVTHSMRQVDAALAEVQVAQEQAATAQNAHVAPRWRGSRGASLAWGA
jgi:hypothetical protein